MSALPASPTELNDGLTLFTSREQSAFNWEVAMDKHFTHECGDVSLCMDPDPDTPKCAKGHVFTYFRDLNSVPSVWATIKVPDSQNLITCGFHATPHDQTPKSAFGELVVTLQTLPESLYIDEDTNISSLENVDGPGKLAALLVRQNQSAFGDRLTEFFGTLQNSMSVQDLSTAVMTVFGDESRWRPETQESNDQEPRGRSLKR